MRLAATATRALSCGAFAALAALAALAVDAVPASAADSAAKEAKRPNVVLVVSDDQAAQTLRPDTMPSLISRVLDRGTSFTDAIVTTPLCCPSRATMLTGQYAHNHGTLANTPGYAALRDKGNTLPAWLRRAGYVTAHVGKYLNRYKASVDRATDVAPGWDEESLPRGCE